MILRARPHEDSELVQVVSAIYRWWSAYGQAWSAVRTLRLRGWQDEDVLAEVLLSACTKARGRSRWDPGRSSVDAYAGLVGRSRILHLLDRRQVEQPGLHIDETRWSQELECPIAPVPWAPGRGPASEPCRDEVRLSLGLRPVGVEVEQGMGGGMGQCDRGATPTRGPKPPLSRAIGAKKPGK